MILNLGKLVDDGADHETARKEIARIEREFAEMNQPDCFDTGDPQNAILQLETHFEHLCAVLESSGVVNASSLSVLQFYLRLEYFRKINQPQKN
jgi:hypothetical protein